MSVVDGPQYVRTHPTLSPEQLARFDRDGYVIVPGTFHACEMEIISSWAEEVEAMPEISGRQWVYRERSADGGDLVNRIEKVASFHTGFEALTVTLGSFAAQALGGDVVLFKDKINFKKPGGGGFEPHQDSQAGWNVYASIFVNVMLCIDEATVDNGCLELAPGHHRRGLLRGMEPLTEDDTRDMQFLHHPTRPGDIVLFDSFTPHQSRPNRTARQRRMYFATYNRASEGNHHERYHADKHTNYPPDIDRVPGREYRYKV